MMSEVSVKEESEPAARQGPTKAEYNRLLKKVEEMTATFMELSMVL
jgi:hypothetical protein